MSAVTKLCISNSKISGCGNAKTESFGLSSMTAGFNSFLGASPDLSLGATDATINRASRDSKIRGEIMTEATTMDPNQNKTMDPVEIYRRNVRTMSNRQLSAHLRRKARQRGSMIDGAFAVILSTVFDNTKSSGVGGNLMPYLR